jgi:nicotinamide-nucleotide amidase
VIRSRVLHTWGQSESGLAEMLHDRFVELDEVGNPTIAFLASGIEGLKVRLTAKADTEEEAEALLAAEGELIAPILGELVFSDRGWSMEAEVIDMLRERGLSLATAESITGGLIASRLTDVPGASDVFRGSVVSYASEVKFDLLDVPEGPVVTEDAARSMAGGAAKVLSADVAVSTTGVAGPDTQEGQAVGTVCLATYLDGVAEAITIRFPGDRVRIKQFACISVLALLRQRLLRDA